MRRWLRPWRDRDRAAHLEALARTVPAAVWSHDMAGRMLLSNGGWEVLTGQPSAETADRGWTRVIHPDDVDRVLADWEELETGPAGGEMRHTFRIIHAATGEERTLAERARLVLDPAGAKLAVVGTTFDVTDEARAEAALRTQATEMAALTDTLPSVVWRFTPHGEVTYCSPQWEHITGQPAGEALGDGWSQRLHPDDYERTMTAWQAFTEAGGEWRNEYRIVHTNGEVRWLLEMAVPVRKDDGPVAYYVGTTMDVTERHLAEHLMAVRIDQQAAVAELGRMALNAETTLHDLMLQATRVLARELGLDSCGIGELVTSRKLQIVAETGMDPAWLVRDHPVESIPLAVAAVETGAPAFDPGSPGGGFAAPIVLRDATFGVVFGFAPDAAAFGPEAESFVAAVANTVGSAIERAHAEDSVRHQALHDALTGLPNRTLLQDRLATALRRTERRGEVLAVLFLDLDHFKVVNDSLGHDAGDELLAGVANRLTEVTRPADTVARLGGDEFVIVCEELSSLDAAMAVARRVVDAFREPFTVGEIPIYASASVGIATVDGEGSDGGALLRDADAAMYRAKEHGRNRCELFDETMRTRSLARFVIESALRGALERDEFELHYQPVVSLADGRLDGFEALIRWRDASGRLLAPGEFIPVAEETGLIVPIGRWVFETACRQAAAWNALRPDARALRVSVNVSARQLADETFPAVVADALAQWGADPGQMGLEITETVLLRDTAAAGRTLAALRELGVRILLDDFGTGYSSLSYIKRFPLSAIKLDRSFVANITESDSDAAIVRAISDMARALSLEVVAEGVEEPGHVATLREVGCTSAQGFLFSPAVPAEDAAALVLGNEPWPVHQRH